MDLTPYLETLRADLAAAAAPRGPPRDPARTARPPAAPGPPRQAHPRLRPGLTPTAVAAVKRRNTMPEYEFDRAPPVPAALRMPRGVADVTAEDRPNIQVQLMPLD